MSQLCIRWPKCWNFNFSISPSNKHSGLISFRFNWFDLLAVAGTFKNLLQHHSLKTSILWYSAFLSPTLTSEGVTVGYESHWMNPIWLVFLKTENSDIQGRPQRCACTERQQDPLGPLTGQGEKAQKKRVLLASFFWLCWDFGAVHGLSLVVASGCYSSCGAGASHCGGFSCCRAQALECGLSSCGAQA